MCAVYLNGREHIGDTTLDGGWHSARVVLEKQPRALTKDFVRDGYFRYEENIPAVAAVDDRRGGRILSPFLGVLEK
jgi:hypothetical protein